MEKNKMMQLLEEAKEAQTCKCAEDCMGAVCNSDGFGADDVQELIERVMELEAGITRMRYRINEHAKSVIQYANEMTEF